MRICIIGGTGHIGENLVKMLLAEKFQVFVVTRGNRPVPAHQNIRFIKKTYDSNVDEWRNLFEEIKPEIIIDILGGSAPILYNAGRLYCKHFIVCGSIWMFGEAKVVPTPENTQSPCIFAGYARRYNDMLKLKDEARMDGVKFTAIMPPNICGPGKIPLDCYGSRDIEHHRQHMGGKPVPLPEPGQTLIGPCDAEDVATGFYLSVLNPEMAADEIFNVGSAYAITAKQFVETYGKIYRVEIPVEWVSWKEYSQEINPNQGANFHFKAHMCPDISKISKKLGYKPKYTPEETMERAVYWMKAQHII